MKTWHKTIHDIPEAKVDIPPDDVELEWFVGKDFRLTGVDTGAVTDEHGGSASYISIMLNGDVFTISEDPSDGYRSTMKEINVFRKGRVNNSFDSVMVKAVKGYVATSEHEVVPDGTEVVTLVDLTTDLPVLTFGTKYDDSGYYPCFVSDYMPQNMVCNHPEYEGLSNTKKSKASLKKIDEEARKINEKREASPDWGAW